MAGAAVAFAEGRVENGLLVVEDSLDRGERAPLGGLQLGGVAGEAESRRVFRQQAWILRGVRIMAPRALPRGHRAMRGFPPELAGVVALETGIR